MGAAFHSPQPTECQERLLAPPVTTPLGWIALVKQLNLLPGDAVGQRKVRVGTGHVAVPFRDLVAQVQLVPEGSRHELSDRRMVLVRVAGGGRENKVGANRSRL